MNKFKTIILSGMTVLFAVGCLEEQALDIQKPYTYDEQYYQNVRDFKKSEHTLSYAYYAAWAPLEGSEGYKDPASYGERLIGLPDSLDIVNLWMGYPSPDPESPNYSPIVYADMKYMQETLGTRFVLHGDAASTREVTYNGEVINIKDAYEAYKWNGDESAKATLYKGLDNHVQLMLDKVNEAGLDGVDVDWEPNDWNDVKTDLWEDHETIIYVMKKLNEALKPQGKLVIMDLFSDVPPAEVNDYIDYLVIQCYTPQIGCSVARLENFYTTRGINAGIPAEKIIACEQGGDTSYALNGGGEWCEYSERIDSGWKNINPIMTSDGSQMYSFEGFARHASENNLAGWGVFYLGRNYYSASQTPYREFRRGIQIANPSIR